MAFALAAAVAGLVSLGLAPVASPNPATAGGEVAAPWVTSSQPTGTTWSVNVLDTATFPSSVRLAIAQVYVAGRPAGSVSFVSRVDGVFSADLRVAGLQPGDYTALVRWTPLVPWSPTSSWSPVVSFSAGGPGCDGPSVPVSLPGVDVSYSTHTTKPWGVRYLPLGLTFTPVSAATSSTCSLVATGTLQVQIGLRFVNGAPQLTIPVDSVATAELDVLRPDATAAIPTCDWVTVKLDCSLDGVSGDVLRWHTEGFSEQIQTSPGRWVQVFNSGPLTFYDSVAPGLSFAEQVQAAETAFHLGLIAHLQDINPIYLIQEPPARLTVVDSADRVTGMASDGRAVRDIPGSVFVAGRSGYSAVVLLAARGRYTVTASGPARSAYSLTLDEMQPGSDRMQATAGRFAASGRIAVCLPTGGVHCSASISQLRAFTVASGSRAVGTSWGPFAHVTNRSEERCPRYRAHEQCPVDTSH